MSWDQIFAALEDKEDLSNEQVTWGMGQILEGAGPESSSMAIVPLLQNLDQRIY
jgi:hypothetical protein